MSTPCEYYGSCIFENCDCDYTKNQSCCDNEHWWDADFVVYFLIRKWDNEDGNNEQIVYVGHTTCLRNRLDKHHRNKIFDVSRIYFETDDKEEALRGEKSAIKRFQPYYNLQSK